MYSSLENVQILLALLKQFEIRHFVISAGTRHAPLVHSLENDDFFTTYSIVDERSASFFAIGLIEELRVPVAVCCTSGTAAANYVSAANEAFYQQLPLLLLTADRNHYYMFQQEEQMIPQEGLFAAICKKVVTLGHVRDQKDFWYFSRLANEALLELTQGEPGPVHINYIVENDYPIHQGIIKFEAAQLPGVKRIERLTLEDSAEKWHSIVARFKDKKILIVYGQCGVPKPEEKLAIEDFAQKYNCVISTDLLSNLYVSCSLPTFTLCRTLSEAEMEELLPDILITMNAHSITEIKARLSGYTARFEHWHVSIKGEVSDPLKTLSHVIACSQSTFFSRFAEMAQTASSREYYARWMDYYQTIGDQGSLNEVEIPYSALYAMQQYLKRIPAKALLHIANSNSIRLANYFLVHPEVAVYGNRGSHGIDGSMSSFIGQAYVSQKLSFLVIGDLSFFYDINILWGKYVGPNVRILLCNNHGGGIFHTYPGTKNIPTLDRHIAAAHQQDAKAIVEASGFTYLSASSKEEFAHHIDAFMQPHSETPILMEVFTEKSVDASCLFNMMEPYKSKSKTLKGKLAKHLPDDVKDTLRRVLRK